MLPGPTIAATVLLMPLPSAAPSGIINACVPLSGTAPRA